MVDRNSDTRQRNPIEIKAAETDTSKTAETNLGKKSACFQAAGSHYTGIYHRGSVLKYFTAY
jgi:hypothetical protein